MSIQTPVARRLFSNRCLAHIFNSNFEYNNFRGNNVTQILVYILFNLNVIYLEEKYKICNYRCLHILYIRSCSPRDFFSPTNLFAHRLFIIIYFLHEIYNLHITHNKQHNNMPVSTFIFNLQHSDMALISYYHIS